jgi:predicted alpha/beta-hydrolase family hydrolase
MRAMASGSSTTGGASTVPTTSVRRKATPGAFLVAPGAGADRDHHTLRALDDGLAPFPVDRFDFPYRKAGKRAPDRTPVAVQAVVEEAKAVVSQRRMRANRLVLGGRSYGGRMCSLAVAGGLPAAGLVLLSYPLHPPGKPDDLRIDHFPALDVPCLFVSGDRDAFGSPDELRAATRTIPGPVTHVFVNGAHDPKNQDPAIVDAVAEWLRSLGAKTLRR